MHTHSLTLSPHISSYYAVDIKCICITLYASPFVHYSTKLALKTLRFSFHRANLPNPMRTQTPTTTTTSTCTSSPNNNKARQQKQWQQHHLPHSRAINRSAIPCTHTHAQSLSHRKHKASSTPSHIALYMQTHTLTPMSTPHSWTTHTSGTQPPSVIALSCSVVSVIYRSPNHDISFARNETGFCIAEEACALLMTIIIIMYSFSHCGVVLEESRINVCERVRCNCDAVCLLCTATECDCTQNWNRSALHICTHTQSHILYCGARARLNNSLRYGVDLLYEKEGKESEHVRKCIWFHNKLWWTKSH